MEALRGQVLGWLDAQVRVRVLPDTGAGWAVVLTAPVYASAGSPAAARMQVVLSSGDVWEPGGLDRVAGVPQRSPGGSALAGHAVVEGRVRPWAAWPASRRVEILAPESLAGPGDGPWLLTWAGPDRLVVGVPAGQDPAPAAEPGDRWAWVFEAPPGSRVQLQPREDGAVPQQLRWVDLRDGAVGTVPVGARPYRWVRVDAGGTRVGAYAGPVSPGSGGPAMVAIGSLVPGAGAERVVDAGGMVAACGWLGDGRMVGLTVQEGAPGWALELLDPPGGTLLARVALGGRDAVTALADGPWWWLADAGCPGLVGIEAACGRVVRWRLAATHQPHAWTVVRPAPLRVAGVGPRGRGTGVVLLEGEPDAGGEGGRLRVRHRVALPAGAQFLGVEDWESGRVLVAGESGEVGACGPGTAATRRTNLRPRVRRVDLGDPAGDGETVAALYLPSRRPAATVVSLAAVPSVPGPPGPLEAWSHTGLLVRLGFAAVRLTMRVPWWPELPDDRIRPRVAERIAAVVRDTNLGEHVDLGALAVRGHSFAASLALIALADTGLFRTAIALSGGYCRSVTPLGFQDERRLLWEAEVVYRDFDAVLNAPRVGGPVLILHGTDDAHPATPVTGAQVLFQALTALGTPARLVLLPGEGHSLRTREGVAVAVAEQAVWLHRWAHAVPGGPEDPGSRPAPGTALP